MKKPWTLYIRSLLILLLTLANSCSSSTKKSEEKATDTPSTDVVVSEEKSNLESFYRLEHMVEQYPKRIYPPPFDYSQDISSKTPIELWILRNEIFARNGYLFEDAMLRGYFNRYDWYQPVFDAPDFKVTLNEKENEFVQKVTQREAKLKETGRYSLVNGKEMISVDHIYNRMQFMEISEAVMKRLASDNFAVVPGGHSQLFHLYDQNQYEYVPTLVTTDLILQLLHKYMSKSLEEAETSKLASLLNDILTQLEADLATEQGKGEPIQKSGASRAYAFAAIARYSLDSIPTTSTGEVGELINEECRKIDRAIDAESSFIRDGKKFLYSSFTPRGYYEKAPELSGYWRAFQWLKSAHFDYAQDDDLFAMALIASIIKRNAKLADNIDRYESIINFVVGEPDGRSIRMVEKLLGPDEISDPFGKLDKSRIQTLRKQIESLPASKILSTGKAKSRVLFFPGRYTLDAEILATMSDQRFPSKRLIPSGLDVMAVLGNPLARKLLVESSIPKQWPEFTDRLNKTPLELGAFENWSQSSYTKRMEGVVKIASIDKGYPRFMNSDGWKSKVLSTQLATWAEIKHDMLLYSEMPYAAEAGEGGGPPPPKHLGYVEPNVAFWKSCVELLELQKQQFEKLGIRSERIDYASGQILELVKFLLSVSEKELRMESLSDDEHNKLSWIGGEVESLTLYLLENDHFPDDEEKISVVADVLATTESGTLEAGVGLGDELYAVVEIDGKPVIARGAVFSYYEFISKRALKDSEWREMLDKGDAKRPEWVKRYITNAPRLIVQPWFSF